MDIRTEHAPAKINLTLDILGRRTDGYHDLRMVMQTVSLSDTISITEQDAGFSLQAAFTPAERVSLEQRAVEAFFAHMGQPVPGLRVRVEKIVPAYAGLGGGSADVAALLRLLRARYCPALSSSALEEIGFQVGSDMPFCVRGGTALAEGRGERLTSLPPLPDCHIVICKPDFGISTPSLFHRADSVSIRHRPDTAGMLRAIQAGDLPGIAARLCNVFEEVLPEEYGEVLTIRDRLRSLGALNAVMSGSGPAVFGLFQEKDQASAAARDLRRDYQETFLTRPVGHQFRLLSRSSSAALASS